VKVTVLNNTLTPVQKDGVYELEKWKKKRSLPQNAYYWKIIVKMISDETGYTTEQTHGKLCQKFLLVKEEGADWVRSTTSLTTAEFETYLEDVKRWASEFLNIVLPDPNQ